MKYNVDTLRVVLSALMVEMARYTMVPDLHGTQFGGGIAWAAYVFLTTWAIGTAEQYGEETNRVDSMWKTMTLTTIAFALSFAARATMVVGWNAAWLPVLICVVLFNILATVRFNLK